MRESKTVRGTASEIQVAPSTAFRWRHKTLDGLRLHYEAEIRGLVEVAELRMPYSEKGSRKTTRPARQHGAWTDRSIDGTVPKVTVVALFDRRKTAELRTTLSSAPSLEQLRAGFEKRLGRVTGLIAVSGPISAYARLARQTGATYFQASQRSGPLCQVDSARSHLRRFKLWLLPFKGVATRYLDNYLAWHRLLTATGIAASQWQFSCWPLVGRVVSNPPRVQSRARPLPAAWSARRTSWWQLSSSPRSRVRSRPGSAIGH